MERLVRDCKPAQTDLNVLKSTLLTSLRCALICKLVFAAPKWQMHVFVFVFVFVFACVVVVEMRATLQKLESRVAVLEKIPAPAAIPAAKVDAVVRS